jgi:peptide deformylase
MSVLKILNYKTSPILRKKSAAVKKIDDRIRTILNDMADTMYYAKGIGLSAPQVGILKRLAVIDTASGPLKLINPVIIKGYGAQYEKEKCLSIPGISGRVKRFEKIHISFLNEKGEHIKMEAAGRFSVILCHEIDHLNGILFIDRI